MRLNAAAEPLPVPCAHGACAVAEFKKKCKLETMKEMERLDKVCVPRRAWRGPSALGAHRTRAPGRLLPTKDCARGSRRRKCGRRCAATTTRSL